jgi:hypothetical protein
MPQADIGNWRTPRARKAALTRSRRPDDPDLVDADRDLRAAQLARHIQRVVDGAPPLTEEQVDRLTALFRTPDLDGAVR